MMPKQRNGNSGFKRVEWYERGWDFDEKELDVKREELQEKQEKIALVYVIIIL